MSLLATFGLYHFMQWHIRRDTKFMGIIRRLGYKTHISRTGIFSGCSRSWIRFDFLFATLYVRDTLFIKYRFNLL